MCPRGLQPEQAGAAARNPSTQVLWEEEKTNSKERRERRGRGLGEVGDGCAARGNFL